MRYYKIIYEKRDFREVWIKINTEDREVAEEEFIRIFERYDDESDTADIDIDPVEIIDVAEIDENGEELEW